MSFYDVITLSLFVLVFVLSPGPGFVATVARTLSHGVVPALWLGFGLISADAVYLLAVVISLGTLAEWVEPMMRWIRLIGGLYLFWIGIKQFRAPPFQATTTKKASLKSNFKTWLTGFFISGSNPKVMVFYLSLLPLFIDLTQLNFSTGAITVATVVITLYIGVILTVLFAFQISRWLKHPRFAVRLNQITGLLMCLVGAFVAFS